MLLKSKINRHIIHLPLILKMLKCQKYPLADRLYNLTFPRNKDFRIKSQHAQIQIYKKAKYLNNLNFTEKPHILHSLKQEHAPEFSLKSM